MPWCGNPCRHREYAALPRPAPSIDQRCRRLRFGLGKRLLGARRADDPGEEASRDVVLDEPGAVQGKCRVVEGVGFEVHVEEPANSML